MASAVSAHLADPREPASAQLLLAGTSISSVDPGPSVARPTAMASPQLLPQPAATPIASPLASPSSRSQYQPHFTRTLSNVASSLQMGSSSKSPLPPPLTAQAASDHTNSVSPSSSSSLLSISRARIGMRALGGVESATVQSPSAGRPMTAAAHFGRTNHSSNAPAPLVTYLPSPHSNSGAVPFLSPHSAAVTMVPRSPTSVRSPATAAAAAAAAAGGASGISSPVGASAGPSHSMHALETTAIAHEAAVAAEAVPLELPVADDSMPPDPQSFLAISTLVSSHALSASASASASGSAVPLRPSTATTTAAPAVAPLWASPSRAGGTRTPLTQVALQTAADVMALRHQLSNMQSQPAPSSSPASSLASPSSTALLATTSSAERVASFALPAALAAVLSPSSSLGAQAPAAMTHPHSHTHVLPAPFVSGGSNRLPMPPQPRASANAGANVDDVARFLAAALRSSSAQTDGLPQTPPPPRLSHSMSASTLYSSQTATALSSPSPSPSPVASTASGSALLASPEHFTFKTLQAAQAAILARPPWARPATAQARPLVSPLASSPLPLSPQQHQQHQQDQQLRHSASAASLSPPPAVPASVSPFASPSASAASNRRHFAPREIIPTVDQHRIGLMRPATASGGSSGTASTATSESGASPNLSAPIVRALEDSFRESLARMRTQQQRQPPSREASSSSAATIASAVVSVSGSHVSAAMPAVRADDDSIAHASPTTSARASSSPSSSSESVETATASALASASEADTAPAADSTAAADTTTAAMAADSSSSSSDAVAAATSAAFAAASDEAVLALSILDRLSDALATDAHNADASRLARALHTSLRQSLGALGAAVRP